MFGYFNRELPRLSPPSRYFDFIDFFAHMTNSPALVPPLIKGLESPDFRVVSVCVTALSRLPTLDSVRAILTGEKTAPTTMQNPEIETYPTRGDYPFAISRLRNQEALPLFETELLKARDEPLKLHLKYAIMGTRSNWPAELNAKGWSAVKTAP